MSAEAHLRKWIAQHGLTQQEFNELLGIVDLARQEATEEARRRVEELEAALDLAAPA